MPNEKLLGIDPPPVPEKLLFTPDGPVGIVTPTGTPSLTPRQAAKLKRIQEASEASMKRQKVQHDQLHSIGYDYSGREQITNLMRRFGRA